MTIITNTITIGLLAVVIAITAVGATSIEAMRPAASGIVVAARRLHGRDGRPADRTRALAAADSSSVHEVSPAGENALERAFRLSGRTEDTGASVVVVGQAAILVEHSSPIYRELSNVLGSAAISGVRATGLAASSKLTLYDLASIDASGFYAEWRTLTFENIDLAGQYAEYANVVATPLGVRQVTRKIEVPTPGYCMRCQSGVYRTSVELVYVPRYAHVFVPGELEPGHDRFIRADEEDLGNDPEFGPATTGNCTMCGGRTMSFGSSLTRVVQSSDYVAGIVAPTPKPTRAPRPAKSRMLHAVGYCMSCRTQVGRRNVRLVSLANGAEATVGNCAKAECGQTVYRMGGYIDLDVVEQMNSIIGRGYAFAYLLPTVVDGRFAWGRSNVRCDLPGCHRFAPRRGYRFQPVPGQEQSLVQTTRAAFCGEHYAAVQQRYSRKAGVRAA